ncbi:unnamed protein product [Penicillium roqueforti FM164]|uniref:Uncharacterized protein n=1 Tax=Penicillium roqueforti (strain FM164) TaxID=1365484 RepID=W6QIV4_PENRF|nr:unnamed protein product [Penicillium roqueforti FM164]
MKASINHMDRKYPANTLEVMAETVEMVGFKTRYSAASMTVRVVNNRKCWYNATHSHRSTWEPGAGWSIIPNTRLFIKCWFRVTPPSCGTRSNTQMFPH